MGDGKVFEREMKIVTYNVNGLRQRVSQFGSLSKLLKSLDADIICFQEIKLTRQELTADLAMAEGYESFFSCTRTTGKGRTGYSGVATYCRVSSAFSNSEVALPVAAEEGFTGLLEVSRRSESGDSAWEPFANKQCLKELTRDELLKIDSEGRCIITDHGQFILFNLYGPRADADDVERIRFKTIFYETLQKRWELLQQQGRRIVVVGDLNIAPSSVDRCEARPEFEQNEFRRWFRSLLVKNGGSFFDVFREKHLERKDAFTCWAVHNGAEEFNYGSRIDHILASRSCFHELHDEPDHNLIACHVEECDIMSQFRRWKPGTTPRWKGGKSTKLEGSDHVPVYVILKEIPDVASHNTPLLSSRYIPEIRGSQQTIVSILMKRQVASQVDLTQASSGPDEGTKTLSLCLNRTIQGCSQTAICSDEVPCVCPNTTQTDSGSFVEGRQIKSLPANAEKKRKLKQNQSSQRSLKSFFQKIPNDEEDVRTATKDVAQSQDAASEIDEKFITKDVVPGCKDADQKLGNGKSIMTMDQKDQTSSASSEKVSALQEWKRIQQLMQDSVPLCNGHREPCVSRVVKKQGPNFGRRFYVCARSEGPSSNPETKCDFFRWAGSKPPKHR